MFHGAEVVEMEGRGGLEALIGRLMASFVLQTRASDNKVRSTILHCYLLRTYFGAQKPLGFNQKNGTCKYITSSNHDRFSHSSTPTSGSGATPRAGRLQSAGSRHQRSAIQLVSFDITP